MGEGMTVLSAASWAPVEAVLGSVSLHGTATNQVSAWVFYPGRTAPAWLEAATKRLDHLLGLDKNWDSYGASPIEPATVGAALQVLADVMQAGTPQPFLGPRTDGGLQAEWTFGDVELGFTVRAGQSPVAFVLDDTREDEWYLDSYAGLSRLLRELRMHRTQ